MMFAPLFGFCEWRDSKHSKVGLFEIAWDIYTAISIQIQIIR